MSDTSIHFKTITTRDFKIKHGDRLYRFWRGVTDDVSVYDDVVELYAFNSKAIISRKAFAQCLSKGLLRIVTAENQTADK